MEPQIMQNSAVDRWIAIIAIVSPIVMIIFGAIVGFLINIFKATVIQKMDENGVDIKALKTLVDLKIQSLENKITKMNEEVLRNYVRKEDIELNDTAHKEMWVELNIQKALSAKLEERIANVKEEMLKKRK